MVVRDNSSSEFAKRSSSSGRIATASSGSTERYERRTTTESRPLLKIITVFHLVIFGTEYASLTWAALWVSFKMRHRFLERLLLDHTLASEIVPQDRVGESMG